jgi:hypothetical protein
MCVQARGWLIGMVCGAFPDPSRFTAGHLRDSQEHYGEISIIMVVFYPLCKVYIMIMECGQSAC